MYQRIVSDVMQGNKKNSCEVPGRGCMTRRVSQRMLSGSRLDLLAPCPKDIQIADIAHGLARIARWNGQTRGSSIFSVAQHSLLVAHLVQHMDDRLDTRWRLAALLHDAAEYAVGDLIAPFKTAIGGQYQKVEWTLRGAVHARFGLPPRLPDGIEDLISRADNWSARLEAVALAGFTSGEATECFPHTPSAQPDKAADFLQAWTLQEAQRRFLATFSEFYDHIATEPNVAGSNG